MLWADSIPCNLRTYADPRREGELYSYLFKTIGGYDSKDTNPTDQSIVSFFSISILSSYSSPGHPGIRRKKEEVLSQLPPKRRQTIFLRESACSLTLGELKELEKKLFSDGLDPDARIKERGESDVLPGMYSVKMKSFPFGGSLQFRSAVPLALPMSVNF